MKAATRFYQRLIENGSFRRIIDRKHTLGKIVKANKYVGTGQKIGYVIILIDS